MKRTLGLILIMLLMFSLPACGSKDEGLPEETKSAYKDGAYHAIYDRMDVRNWKAFVDVTVKDGKITTVNYDYVNDAGDLRTNQQAYTDGFKAVNGYTPREGFDTLGDRLISAQNIEKVDTVTGATHSSRNFKALSKAVLEKAKEGDTSDTVVPLYADGTYRVEADKLDDKGWKPFLVLEIKDHTISAVNFDYANEADKLKSDDVEYQKSMEAVTGTYPAKYEEELEKQLLDKQVISIIDGVSGATSSTANFKALVEYALDDMAEVGETGTKKISMDTK